MRWFTCSIWIIQWHIISCGVDTRLVVLQCMKLKLMHIPVPSQQSEQWQYWIWAHVIAVTSRINQLDSLSKNSRKSWYHLPYITYNLWTPSLWSLVCEVEHLAPKFNYKTGYHYEDITSQHSVVSQMNLRLYIIATTCKLWAMPSANPVGYC